MFTGIQTSTYNCILSTDVFYRQPNIYEVDSLPKKLPPLKQPVAVTALPMLGYLEQTVATAIINALSSVGAVKPKFPFVSSTSSALLFVAYHLKGKKCHCNCFISCMLTHSVSDSGT